MMEGGVTKDDLRQFGLLLMHEMKRMLVDSGIKVATNIANKEDDFEWVKGHKVREMLDFSPKSLQNLRIEGLIRFKKVRGTYYYNVNDVKGLFGDEKGAGHG